MAVPARCLVDVSALVACHFGERAQWHRACNHTRAWVVVQEMRSHDLLGCFIPFDPVNQWREWIESIWTWATTNAVPHPGRHEQPSKLLGAAKIVLLLDYGRVVANG